MLVTITNDAWYGDTMAPWQHFRAVRFRAAENRRPLLRAAITGVSAYVAPDGSVRRQLGVFREGVISASGARAAWLHGLYPLPVARAAALHPGGDGRNPSRAKAAASCTTSPSRIMREPLLAGTCSDEELRIYVPAK